MVGPVNGKRRDIELHQGHLDSLRRGQREVIEQVASSREAINHSRVLLLRLVGKIEDERNPFASERDPF
jgi:hypothetical protein